MESKEKENTALMGILAECDPHHDDLKSGGDRVLCEQRQLWEVLCDVTMGPAGSTCLCVRILCNGAPSWQWQRVLVR